MDTRSLRNDPIVSAGHRAGCSVKWIDADERCAGGLVGRLDPGNGCRAELVPHARRRALGRDEPLWTRVARARDADRVNRVETDRDELRLIPARDPRALWLVADQEASR